mgnify:CR=1 FL=1
MSNFNFEKNKRLLSAQSFQSVFENTDFKISNSNFLLLAHQNRLKHARLGMIVAKKHIRLSVGRNRIKRVIRSSFRLNQQNLAALDIIFLVRKGMNKLSFKDQSKSISLGLDQLKNKIIKVIIIVLIVKFFEKVLKLSYNFTTPNDLLLFSISILSICIGYYLINRK